MEKKSPDKDIGGQAEEQKNKEESHWLLPIPRTKMGNPASANSQTETVSSPFIVLSSAEIEGMHHHCPASMAN